MKTKEAIERIRSRFNKWALDDEDLTALQVLGLVDAESEDERIRNELIRIVKYFYGRNLHFKHNCTKEELIAYLEKFKNFQFDYPGLYFYDGEKLHFQGNPAMEEKQKEQKQEIISISEMVSKYRNTDEYDDDGNYKGKPVNCMVRAYEQGIRDTLLKVKEQKPISTEETELNSVAFLEQLGYTCVPPGAKQKPAEWSEEDEIML